ncbi:hypothetical protein OIU34_33150 [Pararhizobium sp. BT-229]|uniref:hypothetical protein n=1 Tax=Pararhizobium sp. BT-229 TaxID=2986923 RepID=UPI0021F7376F|nr:hypothetical protein [Pararhizobium sp. BT-229]MCV9966726.1 hypothetical protein [Pararhizobium sp. BT-229]
MKYGYASTILAIGAFMALPATAADAPKLESAGALTFGAENVLFVGDTRAGGVHAYAFDAAAFDSQKDVFIGRSETFEGWVLIDEIDRKIAGLIGVDPQDMKINDMVVHRPSQQIFLSVQRGLGPDAEPLIVKVDKGQLEIVDLAAAKHSFVGVGELPSDETLEFGEKQRDLAITDIDYYGGEIFVAGVSTGSFASKLRRIAYPFDGKISQSSIEIWHAVHAQYETRAPIITQEIRELDGTPTLIAVYACTPLVRIPLSELKDGAKIRGEMIGELGYGNTPRDIVSYTDPMDKKNYVLVTNSSRSAVRVALSDIAAAKPMPVEVPNNFGPAGVSQFPIATEAVHLDMLNADWGVSIRRSVDDPRHLELATLPLPFFLDRAAHAVEMNFPGAADPFGYRKHKALAR